jgi:glutathione S-transferase
MKLYYSPGACSLSPRIVLEEGIFSYETERVDLTSGKTETGADYRTINPNGYVPALLLDDGQVLTEGPAIVQYLADRAPETRLAPPVGSMERYRLMEWLNFISTELHKSFGTLFNPQAPEAWKDLVKTQLARRFDYVNSRLDGKVWLMGDDFTVADMPIFLPYWAGAITSVSILPHGQCWSPIRAASPHVLRCRRRSRPKD